MVGLVNRPELNGVRGRMLRHIPDKDRWKVKLNGGQCIAALKRENFILIDDNAEDEPLAPGEELD